MLAGSENPSVVFRNAECISLFVKMLRPLILARKSYVASSEKSLLSWYKKKTLFEGKKIVKSGKPTERLDFLSTRRLLFATKSQFFVGTQKWQPTNKKWQTAVLET